MDINLREQIDTDELKGLGVPAPRISVVICTYNRRNLVLSALASLRRQTLAYSLFEVIVVDNGSDDGTYHAVRQYVRAGRTAGFRPEDYWRVRCLLEPRNGLPYARQTALEIVSGEIVVFLDDDTLADPTFLERLLAAYEETNADGIGGRVELSWERPRPHWVSLEMLEMLGRYTPAYRRFSLEPSACFSSCCFSVKLAVLRSVGGFAPMLGKRLHIPAGLEVEDLCQRLHQAGYRLWYEPTAVVAHRAPAARLKRAFFVGRAYWRGRSEVLVEYLQKQRAGHSRDYFTRPLLWACLAELWPIIVLALLHRPLLSLAGRPTAECLLAALEQARHRGRLQQLLYFIEHSPPELTCPAVLLVRPVAEDAASDLFESALLRQEVMCTVEHESLPYSWLWQQRAFNGQAVGIIHLFRVGAFEMSYRQRQRLLFRLWLARRLGIHLVMSDVGGWWQGARSLGSRQRRALERHLQQRSEAVFVTTYQPQQLYVDQKLRELACYLPPAGFHGYYAQPVSSLQARQALGIPLQAAYVYVCLAYEHSEQELVYLVEAFKRLCVLEDPTSAPEGPQLLIVGMPGDNHEPLRLLRRLAANPAVHLALTRPGRKELPLYLGVADALVLPHLARRSAGLLEVALLGLSYRRVVVVPDLPRFSGLLSAASSVLYIPSGRESLAQAMRRVRFLKYPERVEGSIESIMAVAAEQSWTEKAARLHKVYQQVISKSSRQTKR